MDIISIFSNEFCGTLIRFFICMVVNWGIIHFLYYRKSHRNDFYFTFMLMTVAIFFLVYFMMGMDRGKATMGVGLGLFGIFSIMRYRTDTMPVREMTYLFLIVCLSVVHSMAESFGELLIVDVLTIIAIIICEMRFKIHATKLIQYDRKLRRMRLHIIIHGDDQIAGSKIESGHDSVMLSGILCQFNHLHRRIFRCQAAQNAHRLPAVRRAVIHQDEFHVPAVHILKLFHRQFHDLADGLV